MSQEDGSPNEPWQEFGRRWEWGKPLTRKESKKAKKKRLRGVSGNKKRNKKKNNNNNKEYDQLSMHGCNITKTDAEACGHKMTTKRENTVRIGLQNMQLLPVNAKHYKSRQSVHHV